MTDLSPEHELELVDHAMTHTDRTLPSYYETYEVFSDVHRYLVTKLGENAVAVEVEQPAPRPGWKRRSI